MKAKEFGVVPGLPKLDKDCWHQWYLCDPNFGIPSGKEVRYDEEGARILFRIAKRVGLVTRADHYFHGPFDVPMLRMVGLCNAPSDEIGVPVEAPEYAGKVEEPGFERHFVMSSED